MCVRTRTLSLLLVSESLHADVEDGDGSVVERGGGVNDDDSRRLKGKKRSGCAATDG